MKCNWNSIFGIHKLYTECQGPYIVSYFNLCKGKCVLNSVWHWLDKKNITEKDRILLQRQLNPPPTISNPVHAANVVKQRYSRQQILPIDRSYKAKWKSVRFTHFNNEQPASEPLLSEQTTRQNALKTWTTTVKAALDTLSGPRERTGWKWPVSSHRTVEPGMPPSAAWSTRLVRLAQPARVNGDMSK